MALCGPELRVKSLSPCVLVALIVVLHSSYKFHIHILPDLLVCLFLVDINCIGCLDLLVGKFVFKYFSLELLDLIFREFYHLSPAVSELPVLIPELPIHTGTSGTWTGTSGRTDNFH